MDSLEIKCLDIIVEEFDRFHFAFSVSGILNRHLEFLQRKYAFELISGLSKKAKLQDEYLEILLNSHLKYLEGKWFEKSRYHNSIQDIICRLPNLREINLYEICNDEILEKITEFCPNVIEIDASWSSVTDAGLKCLCMIKNGKVSCPNLKKIFLSNSNVTDEGVEFFIQNLPSLEEIQYKNVPRILYFLHIEDFNNLKKLPSYNLVHLDVFPQCDLSYFAELLKMCLTVCPRLKSFCCKILNKEQFSLFENASLELEKLFIRSEQRIDVNTFLKNNGSKLVSLEVSYCLMSVNVLSASCPKLKHLYIDNVILLDDHCNSQLGFDSLIECHFNDIIDDNANHKAVSLLLASSPKLERLHFFGCSLSSKTKWVENNHLKNVILYFCRVDIKFIKDLLLSSPSLKNLFVKLGYISSNEKVEIFEFAETLPNKPKIHI